MPPFRRAAVVLITLTLAGCATEVVEGSAAPADPAGPLSTITDRHLLVELEDRSIVTTAVGPDGAADPPAHQGDRGPLELWRRAGDGWEETTLDDQRVQTYGAELGTTSDGTVVVTGYAERGYVITRVTPDGEVSSVPVAEDVDHETTQLTRAEVTPDGDVVYLAYLDEETRPATCSPSTRSAARPAPSRPSWPSPASSSGSSRASHRTASGCSR